MRALLAWLLLVLFGGCGGHDAEGAGDCRLAIRTRDVVYMEAGFVKGSAQSDGRAEYASCDDVGDDAQGVYFPEDARQVQVWSFQGQHPETVLGVRESTHEFRVFVAEGEDPAAVVRAVRQSLTTEAGSTRPRRHERADRGSGVRLAHSSNRLVS